MARPEQRFPTPTLCKRGNAFRVRWYAHKNLYEFSLGIIPKDVAKAVVATLAAAFAGRGPFPEEALSQPAVKRYIATENGIHETASDAALITAYYKHQKASLTSQWPLRVKYFLNKALEHMGTLQKATPNQIVEFLDAMADAVSPQSRNRAQTAISGFFRWLRVSGYVHKFHNPMDGIKQVRETPKADGIVIWEAAELRQLLKKADKLRDGIAIWIAIFAGLRRNEIANLKWVHVSDTVIDIVKSKTGERRQVPLSARLAKRLAKESKDRINVVPWPDAFHGWETASNRLIREYLPKALPELYKKHPEKFGWNALRHTFASRHAQNGLSLDIIAAWMGNTPNVCKKHYARYVPKNKRDTRIDGADKI